MDSMDYLSRSSADNSSPDASGPAAASGFTLVEILVALVVAGILAAIAVPSFQNLSYANKRASVINDLMAAMHLARGEAIKRGAPVVLCAGKTQCGTVNDWGSGWILFANTVNSGSATLDAGETVIQRGAAAPDKVTISANSANFVYRPLSSQTPISGTLTVCTPLGSAEARAIIVSASGRPRSSDKDSSGGALTCP